MKFPKDFVLYSRQELEGHDWEAELRKLKQYATTLGYEVIMGTVDEIFFIDKLIVINRNRTPRNRCYVFAHELGHAHIREQYRDALLNRFPGYAYAENTKGHHVSKIEEEVLAWDEAIWILGRFKVPIDENAFNRVKRTCLGTYLINS